MDFAAKSVSWFMKSIGILLINFCLILVSGIFYVYTYEISSVYYYTNNNTFQIVVLLLFGFWLAFNVIFNFLMSCFVHPGKIPNNFGPDLSKLNQLEIDYIKNNHAYSAQMNICRKCIKVKPNRAHHCSICDTCILKMDHHCPWINNCVGHNNQRYFLLFLFWVLIATGWVGYLYVKIQFDDSLDITADQLIDSIYYRTAGSLCVVLFIVLIFFSGWNWYLGLTGQTAIEFWGKRLPDSLKHDSSYEYSLSNWILNLEQIFGTRNLFKMILPSIRNLPHDGTMWLRNSTAVYTTVTLFQDTKLDVEKL